MIRRMAKVVVFVVLGHAAGCAWLHGAAKPASYGTELAACEQTSTTWDQYEPCCVDVASRYARDPAFCFRGSK